VTRKRPDDSTKKPQIAFQVSDEIKSKMDKIAEDNSVSVSAIMIALVKRYLSVQAPDAVPKDVVIPLDNEMGRLLTDVAGALSTTPRDLVMTVLMESMEGLVQRARERQGRIQDLRRQLDVDP